MNRFVTSAVVLLVVAGFVGAETLKGCIITKIEGDKIFLVVGKTKKAEGTKKELALSKDVKITRTMGEETKTVELEKFTKFLEKAKRPVRATITTEGEGEKATVTKIELGGGKKKPKKDSK